MTPTQYMLPVPYETIEVDGQEWEVVTAGADAKSYVVSLKKPGKGGNLYYLELDLESGEPKGSPRKIGNIEMLEGDALGGLLGQLREESGLAEARPRLADQRSVVKIGRSGKSYSYFYQGSTAGRWDELEGLDAQEVFRKTLAVLKMYPQTTVLLPNRWSFGRRSEAVRSQRLPFVLLAKQGQEVDATDSPKDFWTEYGMQLLRGQVKLKPRETRPAPGW